MNASAGLMQFNGADICTFAGWSEAGRPIIELDDLAGVFEARSTVELSASDIGAQVLVQFANAGTVPIVTGILAPNPARIDETSNSTQLTVDDTPTPLEITGEREITLRCGKASITLTKAGKIILRGTYISSRSSGMNRIKGGSVQLN